MPNHEALRVLIVDDEPLARQRIADLLSKCEDVEIVGQIDNGPDAVRAIRKGGTDLVFLDVQMPGQTGLEVMQEVGLDAMPPTVFVTAYDQYAVLAFDMAAVDYLLKPFDDERFEHAFERARRSIRMHEVDAMRDRLLALFGKPMESQHPERCYLERIAVEMRGKVRVVSVREIDYITASGSYAELHLGSRVHLIREQMQALADRLDPKLFFRIHRSTIVRLDRIESLHHAAGGDYAVSLHNGHRLKVSRSRRDELARRLGLPAA